jgi:hypothetical protein
MTSLINYPLTVLVVFMMFSVLGASIVDMSAPITIPEVNSTSHHDDSLYIPIANSEYNFKISAIQGAILMITTIIAIGAVVGIRVLGTGVSSITVEIVTKGTFYFALWGILSAFAQPLISQIYLLGSIIYIILSLMYVIGFVQSINSGGSDE